MTTKIKDVKLKLMEDTMDIYEKTLGQMRVDVAVILNKVKYIEEEMKSLKNTLNDMDARYVLRHEHLDNEELEAKFVTHTEFEPVKKSVFAFIGFIILSVLGALLSFIIKK